MHEYNYIVLMYSCWAFVGGMARSCWIASCDVGIGQLYLQVARTIEPVVSTWIVF